ncbi:hypothetical protein B0H63DRAFT_205173 [Podospora didyma]|uniref:Uncharacterized protein n=1 Tax=Podospora didyma TaxID=330526 RepID=A0AAE0NH47_9PEZI|nr:hypothetical protein B0H63DRAFT_205173 [Podospora didyma]
MADASSENAPTGILAWFPWGRQDLPGWRFDVITLLAVIGESSVAEHAQTLTASTLCLLPRIIPAPQALLRPVRPQRLPEVTAKMAGVYGGVVLDTVGFFANIMHPLEPLKPFAFKVLEIKHKPPGIVTSSGKTRGGWKGWWFRGRKRTALPARAVGGSQPQHRHHHPPHDNNHLTPATHGGGTSSNNSSSNHKEGGMSDSHHDNGNGKDRHAIAFDDSIDPELGTPEIRRAYTMSEKFTDILANGTMVSSQERFTVPPAYYSPVNILSVLSFLLSCGLVVAARYWEDGTAIVAVVLMSLASSVVGYASWWRPLLMNRRTTNRVPRGDVVIRTREGAFVLIKCTEEVARELYSGTEECRYVSTKYHRAFMGLGMVLLMVSVVLLGNCGWNSQVFIGASYIVLNGLYWAMGLLPAEYFWDLSRYDCKDITPADAMNADEPDKSPNVDLREGTPSFTRTLWFAIRETGLGSWAERSGAMPKTDQWNMWMEEALQAVKRGERNWPAIRIKNEIMGGSSDDGPSPTTRRKNNDFYDDDEDGYDNAAKQRAPLLEVQPPRRRSTQGQGGGF